jgi:hypothetical protein
LGVAICSGVLHAVPANTAAKIGKRGSQVRPFALKRDDLFRHFLNLRLEPIARLHRVARGLLRLRL